MDRIEIHKFLSTFFPNTKHFLFQIFEVSDDEILEEAKRLEGYKIPVKFSDEKISERIKLLGLTDVVFYNAFLEVLRKKYKNLSELSKELEEWKKRSIIQYV